jgi:hypothetical protein
MSSTTGPGNLRACISFIQRNPKHDAAATLLLANGSLRLDRIGEYSDLVIRTFQEIRQLFREDTQLILDVHSHLDRYCDPGIIAVKT